MKGDSAILTHMSLNRREKVLEMIDRVDVNITDGSQQNMLHLSAENMPIEVVDTLIRRGINVNHQEEEGFTPLYYAVDRKRIDIVKRLLEAGADPNIRNRHGNSPLWPAISTSQQSHDLVQSLLDYGADPLSKNRYGSSCIDGAVLIGRKDLVELMKSKLREKGIDAAASSPPATPEPVAPPEEIDISGTNRDILRWVWKNLVPKSGQSDYVQGEVLRAIEKLRWEAQNNGNINWNEDFEMFGEFIQATLLAQNCFSAEDRKSICKDVDRLLNFLPVEELTDDSQKHSLPYVDNDLYDRLTGHLAIFCRHHPKVIKRPHDPNQLR